MKKWMKSKKLWVNIIAIAAIIVQAEYGFIVSPEAQLCVLGIVDLIMIAAMSKGLKK